MITKNNNYRVMEIFFKNPYRQFHIRELSRMTGLSSTGIIKIVKRLKKENLLISRKEKHMEDVMPNFEGRFYILKRIYNIYSLYDSGLVAYLKEKMQMPKAIFLFGSYADGTDSEKSDVDIAVVSKYKKIPELKIFEDKLLRKINIHIVNLSQAPAEFQNSIANGVKLEGFAEIIK